LRARPEPTQWEHLSDASFLGKLLVLPANVRLDWKVFARYKHSCLFGLIISNEEKKVLQQLFNRSEILKTATYHLKDLGCLYIKILFRHQGAYSQTSFSS
jgi:hypothetical protein